MQDALREYRGSLWGHILENCVCEAVTTLEPKPHSIQGESSTLWHSQISLQVASQETLWLLQYRQGRRHELCMSSVLFLCRLLCAKSATYTLNREQASCPECIRIAILVSWPKFMMQVQHTASKCVTKIGEQSAEKSTNTGAGSQCLCLYPLPPTAHLPPQHTSMLCAALVSCPELSRLIFAACCCYLLHSIQMLL